MKSNLWIATIGIFLVALFLYVGTKPQISVPTPSGSEVIPNTTATGNSSDKKVVILTSKITCDSTVCTDGTTIQPFKIDLPTGSVLTDEYIEGQKDRYYLYTGKDGSGPLIQYFRTFSIKQGDTCEPGKVMTIHGLQFTRNDGEGAWGGMMLGSIDSDYCIAHNGIMYDLGFTMEYQRTSDNGESIPPPPDPTVTRQKFDSEIEKLQFQFIGAISANAPVPELPNDVGSFFNSWPPIFYHSSLTYSCSPDLDLNINKITDDEHNLNGRIYCIHRDHDGYAGGSGSTYTYTTTSENGGTNTTIFSLNFPDCGVYKTNEDDAVYNGCIKNQSTFAQNLNALIDSLMPR